MKLSSKYEKQSPGFCARMKDGTKIMLKCRPNRRRRYRRPLKGLLNEAEKFYKFFLVNDVDDDDEDDNE